KICLECRIVIAPHLYKRDKKVRGFVMAERNLNNYIEQLQLLRELESKNLIRSEVAIKHQDRIVTEMLQTVSSEAISEGGNKVSSSSSDVPSVAVVSSYRDYIFI